MAVQGMGLGVATRVVTFQGDIVDIDGRAAEGGMMVVTRSKRSGGEENITVCREALKRGGRVVGRFFIVKLGKIPG